MRRKLLKVLCAFALFGVISAHAADAHVLKFATLAPQGSTWMKAFDAWGKELASKSQGRLVVKFYPGGIAQSQHPIDGRKGAANPGSEVKELFLPLTQINLQAQLSPTIAVEMQYYFDWANTRAPEGGTFLAPADLTMQGPDQLGGDPRASANLPRRAPLEPDDQQNVVKKRDF